MIARSSSSAAPSRKCGSRFPRNGSPPTCCGMASRSITSKQPAVIHSSSKRNFCMPDRANKTRCRWAADELSAAYHDKEWGVPVHDDRVLFEFLILEGAQAGLSWITILKKRPAYRAAFDRFDPRKVARYDEAKIVALLANDGIVRNRLKIRAAV